MDNQEQQEMGSLEGLSLSHKTAWNRLACEGRFRPFGGACYIRKGIIRPSDASAIAEFKRRDLIRVDGIGRYVINPSQVYDLKGSKADEVFNSLQPHKD
jgi:hypothetical protein